MPIATPNYVTTPLIANPFKKLLYSTKLLCTARNKTLKHSKMTIPNATFPCYKIQNHTLLSQATLQNTKQN